MNGMFEFSDEVKVKIVRRFGEGFCRESIVNISECIKRFEISQISVADSFSANLVLFGTSKVFGEIVMKFCGRPEELLSEYNALIAGGKDKYCEVYYADKVKGYLIEERIMPGDRLRLVDSLAMRLDVFVGLYNGLHEVLRDTNGYNSYKNWVYRITDYMSGRKDWHELYGYMNKAKEIFDELVVSYDRQVLLHGDFHHDNILKYDSGLSSSDVRSNSNLGLGVKYKLIDPKGVVGDPIFDIPRFVLNEFSGMVGSKFCLCIDDKLEGKVRYIIRIFEKKLGIPGGDLLKCLYVETVMAMCWSVEDGALVEAYKKVMEPVWFVDSLLESDGGLVE